MRRTWTPAETKYLSYHWGEYDAGKIAAYLQRDTHTVRCKAWRMGLPAQHQGQLSLTQLSAQLGYSKQSVVYGMHALRIPRKKLGGINVIGLNWLPKLSCWLESNIKVDRSTITLTYCGEVKTINEWADHIHVKPGTLRARLRRGWDLARALQV